MYEGTEAEERYRMNEVSGPTARGSKEEYRAGKANWEAFPYSWHRVEEAANDWQKCLEGVDKPWLCWNVDRDWCRVQQRLVLAVGWTPVVGYDPRAGVPSLEKGAVSIDFNYRFEFPALHMVFPLESTFLYCARLAFWHSDLLVRENKLIELAEQFANLEDGVTAAVDARPGIRARVKGLKGRYWELIGCTTRGASLDQFQKGTGWWRHIEKHPNCPSDVEEIQRRTRYGYDHGVGILYWERRYGGRVVRIHQRSIEEGHCTGIGNKGYTRVSPRDERRDLTRELSLNYDLEEVCRRLNLTKYL